MKKTILLMCLLISTVTFAKSNQKLMSAENEIPDSPNSPNPSPIPVTETVLLSAGFSGSECFTIRQIDGCKIEMIPSLRNIGIEIEESNYYCNSPLPDRNSCVPTQRQGDWLKSIYLSNQRFIGIITIQKYLNPENQSSFFYQAIVEILGNNKSIARMTTTFNDISQIPNARLEAPEITKDLLGGTSVINLSLTIAPSKNLDLRPLPGDGLKVPQGRIMNNNMKDRKLSKVQWKIEKGNLKVLE